MTKTFGMGIAQSLLAVSTISSGFDLGKVSGLVSSASHWSPPNERPELVSGLEHVKTLVNDCTFANKRDVMTQINDTITAIGVMSPEKPAAQNGKDATHASQQLQHGSDTRPETRVSR